jgi:hypothetical protein
MYWGDPMMAALAVICSWLASVLCSALEMPKSSTFTRGEPSGRSVKNRFDGFRSRWMMPSE